MKLVVSVLFGAAMLFGVANDARADAAAGESTFKASKCLDCHYTQGPAREKTIDDQLAKKGPELWYAGSKFQKEWLSAWLQNPVPIRPLKYGALADKNPDDHPKLAGADAANVSDFLMGLTSKGVEEGKIKAKKSAKGRLIFTKKMPCSGCHQYPARKKVKGGLSGPSLVGAGTRLNPDWIYAYLKNPKTFKPVKMMPVFEGALSDKDMVNVARYVAYFK